jgi:hypothetical protein
MRGHITGGLIEFERIGALVHAHARRRRTSRDHVRGGITERLRVMTDDLEKTIMAAAQDFGLKSLKRLRKRTSRGEDLGEIDGQVLDVKAMVYRYAPKKREQLLRLAAALSKDAGRRVSLNRTLDAALDAFERELNRKQKKRERVA